MKENFQITQNNKGNLRFQITIFLTIVLFCLFLFLGGVVYVIQKSYLEKVSQETVKSQLLDVYDLVKLQISGGQSIVQSASDMADEVLASSGFLTEADSLNILMNVQVDDEVKELKLKEWLLNDTRSIHTSVDLIDQIHRMTNCDISFLQLTPLGAVRISTSILNNEGDRISGTLIGNKTQVVRSITDNQVYAGRTFINGNWYMTSYKPITINGEIKGAIEVALSESDLGYIKDVISNKKVLKNGFPFIMDISGNVILHPTDENQNWLNKYSFAKHLVDTKKGEYKYSFAGVKQTIFYEYYASSGYIIAISVPDEELYGVNIESVRNILLVAFILVMIFSSIIIYYVLGRYLKPLYYITETLQELGIGKEAKLIEYNTNNEFEECKDGINQLIKLQNKYQSFCDDLIEEKDKNIKIINLDPSNKFGHTLQDLSEKRSKKQLEEKDRRKINEAITTFNLILHSGKELKELGDDIVSELAKHLNVNQVWLFLINKDGEKEASIDLLSCYAYNKIRYHKKSFKIGEGLIGEVCIEKEAIFMSNVPDDYHTITSGLGEALPKKLFVVPLKLNQEVIGVIELLSFNNLGEKEFSFTDKVLNNIASAIKSTRNAEHTQKLLFEAQENQKAMTIQDESLREGMEELESTQDEMRRKELLMKAQLKAIGKIVFLIELDPKGNIIFANNIFGKVFGYFESEYSKLNFDNIQSQGLDLISFETIIKKFKYQDSVQKDFNLLKKIGSEVWVKGVLTPLYENKELKSIIFISYDITDIQKLKMQVNGLNRKFGQQNKLLDSLRQMIVWKEKELQNKHVEFEEIKKGLTKSFNADLSKQTKIMERTFIKQQEIEKRLKEEIIKKENELQAIKKERS